MTSSGLRGREDARRPQPMIAVVAGHPSIDRLYEVDVLRPGEIHRPGVPLVLAGGKGLNAARALATLRGRPYAIAVLRGHAGRWIEESLGAESIDGAFVWSDGETRTSVSVVDRSRPAAPLTEFYESSSPIAAETWVEIEGLVAAAVQHSDMLCLSGSLIPGAPADGYRRLAELARRSGVPVALDTHGQNLLGALDGGPALVKVNAAEAAAALDFEPPAVDVLAWAGRAAADLRARAGGHGACVVTCGADGMALVDEAGAVYHGHLDEAAPYPVGSGDAALAALAIAIVGGAPWEEALAAALGAGAANAALPGPGVLDREQASRLSARAVVERVAR